MILSNHRSTLFRQSIGTQLIICYLLVGLLMALANSQLIAQQSQTSPYYLFPINPGQQNYLAGTMGELRSSHFHAGIDIKTGGKEGLPVYATADGYMSRIRVSTGGYGKALYMNHPNGTTSVYAHLSKFSSNVEERIFEEQYKQESYTVQIFPQKGEFSFKKGDIIGYSGNTGSSSGPHLHFEIRDQNQKILDPLQYDFSEIVDNIAPQIKQIAFISLDEDARVNETYGRFEFDLIKNNEGIYQTRVPIALKGNIGIEIYAFDYLNGVYNRNGIPKTVLTINGDTIFSEFKDKMSFSKQRNILVHMDYHAYRSSGIKFNKLFIDQGNTNDIYDVPSTGFYFNDSIHNISIFCSDSYGNISAVESSVNKRKILNRPDPAFEKFEIYRGKLHLKSRLNPSHHDPVLYFGDVLFPLSPYREDKKTTYYLWNLSDGLPDSILHQGEITRTGIYAELPPQTAMSFHNHHMNIELKSKSLFDTLYLRFSKGYDTVRALEIFDFPHRNIPLKSSVSLTLKPTYDYQDSIARVYSVIGNNLGFVGGEWEDGNITFSTRDLVKFTIVEDSIPPVITPKIINQNQLSFEITDELSGIKSYKASLDGAFLLMAYEPKQKRIWAIPKNQNIPITGEFVLELKDNTGNKTFYKRNL